MTVCIAAICEDGKSIVVAADRMFTSPMNVEFETDEKKIESISNSCVALAAGSSASSAEVLNSVRVALNGKTQVSILEVVGMAREQYSISRSRKIDETIVVATLGNDFLEFRKKGFSLPTYLQPQQNSFQQITAMANQYDMQLELLIAGVDTTGAHIYQVANPGAEYSLDKLGHAAVGSGALHAIIYLSLVAQTSHKGLIETLFCVYDAKKAAEVAPGVGSMTDMAIVDKDHIWHCTEQLLKSLEDISAKTRKKALPDLKEVQDAYEKSHK